MWTFLRGVLLDCVRVCMYFGECTWNSSAVSSMSFALTISSALAGVPRSCWSLLDSLQVCRAGWSRSFRAEWVHLSEHFQAGQEASEGLIINSTLSPPDRTKVASPTSTSSKAKVPSNPQEFFLTTRRSQS